MSRSLPFFWQNFGIYLELYHDDLFPQLSGNPVCCNPVCCNPVCCNPVCGNPVCCNPVCGNPVCCNPVCCNPVCCNPVCCNPICGNPVCGNPVCCNPVCGNPVYGPYSFIVTDLEYTNWSPRGSHMDVAVPFRTNYHSAFSFVVKQSVNFTLQDENTRSFETSASKTSQTRRQLPGDLKLCQKMIGSFVGTNFDDHPVVCAVGVRLLEHPAGR